MGAMVVDERDEWCFDFHVTSSRLIISAEAEKLMDEVLVWAESHQLGIGGGYGPSPLNKVDVARTRTFHFGLCASQEGQLIPRQQAYELWERIQGICDLHRIECVGCFRPFTPEELGKGQS